MPHQSKPIQQKHFSVVIQMNNKVNTSFKYKLFKYTIINGAGKPGTARSWLLKK